MKKIEESLQYIEKIKPMITNKTYKIYTMGCQLNENDSEKISGMIEKMGYIPAGETEETDLVVFNTCCVRENAEDRLFGKLGEMKRMKEQRGTIIAIGGCMMQEEHMVKKIKESYPYVDIIFGTHTLYKFPEDMYIVLQERKKLQDILQIDGEIIEGLPIKRKDTIKASVTIMNGCNNFCSYCIVPYVRGRERSRRPKDILDEVQELAKQGYKEIMLLGQNVNSYMRSEREKGMATEMAYKGIDSFAKLLREMNTIEGIERIRFISPHPKDFTEDVIDAIRDCEKICKFVHLPMQSGSTEVLKQMNRKYTKEQYLALVEKMKEKIPGITFSTDIIVGFPGETEADFADTLDVVETVHFEQVYMFIYSKRVGTPGAEMENQVPEEVKHERFDRLKALVEKQIAERNQEYIGTLQTVIVEGTSKNNADMLTGRTESNKVVVWEGTKEQIGSKVTLRIVSEHMWYLKGIIE